MSDEKDDEFTEETDQSVETEAEEDQATEQDAEQIKPAEMKGFAILQIITCTNDEIEKCREKLEKEPSGRILAYLQGKIPGCKFALKAIDEIFRLDAEYLTGGEKPCKMSLLTQEQILGAEKDMEELQQTEKWQQFQSRIQEKTDSLKSFLLFEAKKSRDLDVQQGVYKGMITYQTVFAAIEDSADFWRKSLFKKRDMDGESVTRDANNGVPALSLLGLPEPEDAEYEDQEERGDDSLDDTENEGEYDPDMDV